MFNYCSHFSIIVDVKILPIWLNFEVVNNLSPIDKKSEQKFSELMCFLFDSFLGY